MGWMVRVLSFMKLQALFTHTFVLLRRLLHIHYRNSLAAAVLPATLLGFMYLQLLILWARRNSSEFDAKVFSLYKGRAVQASETKFMT